MISLRLRTLLVGLALTALPRAGGALEPVAALSPEQAARLFPTLEANAAALEAERLGCELDLRLAPIGSSRENVCEREPPSGPPRGSARKPDLAGEVGRYLETALEQPGMAPLPPDPVLMTLLSGHRVGLLRLRELVLEGEGLIWKQHRDRPLDYPLLGIFGLRRAQDDFVAMALERASAGDRGEALEWLEASARFVELLRDRPVIVEQLIAHAAVRRHARALRKLAWVPEDLVRRLVGHDHRAAMRRAQLYGLWLFTEWARTQEHPLDELGLGLGEPDWLDRGLHWLSGTRPVKGLMRKMVLWADERDRLLLAELDDLGRCEAPEPRSVEAYGPGWVDPELLPAALRTAPGASVYLQLEVDRLEVELELTDKFLAMLRSHRRHGSFPETLPGGSASLCPGGSWIDERRPDGFSLRYAGTELWQPDGWWWPFPGPASDHAAPELHYVAPGER